MVRYYEGLAGSPATVHSLKRAWAKYSLDYGLINSLSDFGIYFDPVLNMLVGCDSCCWNAAEMFIQNMKRRVIVNFHMLRAVFSNFSKNNASSSNGHEQRIANLEKEMEETKAGQTVTNHQIRKLNRTVSEQLVNLSDQIDKLITNLQEIAFHMYLQIKSVVTPIYNSPWL
ncbi:hypothetical protein K1719_026931 [Acacia pycnantha]|nr:hypothetical protein K1719_026931 [Acacia pycnantha]